MDIQNYIASGVIELYALGICTEEEKQQLESLALQHPEIDVEVQSIRASLEAYALKHAQRPPPELREKIMNSIKQGDQSNTRSGRIVQLEPTLSPPLKRIKPLNYAAAAAIVILISSISFNYLLYSRVRKTEQDLAALTGEKVTLSSRLESQKTSYLALQNDLALLKNPDIAKMPMKGNMPAADAQATVFCNTRTNEIYLDIKKLPEAPDSMQYQFWAIVDGKPVSAGMIDLCVSADSCNIHKMLTVANARSFAISLEKKGGNPVPKGQIYASTSS